jgi:LysM repeat protein
VLEATATASEVELPTSTPVPTEASDEEQSDVVTEYPVPDSYTLHQGEFIFCLARRYNILPDDIETYNGYESGTLLYPGDTIALPPNGRPFVGNRALRYHPDTYTVSFGETAYSIACLYGDVDPRAIAAANDIDLDQELSPGTVLQIP